ncbi:hypothetical protein BJV82DRAFT_674318 [Fennellomyces sp. T-0311]|nr:hypothetical protein BJV82DRAFT_674318 [Fennellomyces sp. T-0311]
MYHFTPLAQQPDLLSLLSSTALSTSSSSAADAAIADGPASAGVCDMFNFQQTYDDALVFPSTQSPTQFEDPSVIEPKQQQDRPITTTQPYYSSHNNDSYYYWPPTATSACSPEPTITGQSSNCLNSEYNNEDLLTLHLLQQQSSNMYQTTATDDGSHSSNSSVKTAVVDNYDPYRRHSFDHTERPLAVAQPVPDSFQYQHRGSLPNVYMPAMQSWNDKKRPVSSPRQQRKRRIVTPKDVRSKSVDFKDWLPVPTTEVPPADTVDASFPEISDVDWDTARQNPSAVPRRQKLRYEGDEYTPKWVRYTGQLKEGYCDSCKPGKWLQLKNSAYWYHKQFFHGISSVSGKRFMEPLEQRAGDHDVVEGLCHQCRQFVPICNAKRKTSVLWYRHAHKASYN